MLSRAAFVLSASLFFAACGGSGGSGAGDNGGGQPAPPANSVPTATSASYSTSDLAALEGMLEASDVDGDAITYAIATAPSRGTLSAFDAATGAFTYTPDPFENGLDSFAFTAADSQGTSSPATVSVEVLGWPGTQQFGTVAADGAPSGGLVVTRDDDLIFGGFSEAAIDGQAFGGERDAWVRQLSRRGDVAWTFVSRNPESEFPRSVLPHPSGDGVYVVVTIRSDVGAIIGADVVRLDRDGIEVWREPIEFGALSGRLYIGYWSGLGSDGDLYVASHFDSDSSSLLSRIDGTNGATLWNKRLSASDIDPASAFIDNTAAVLVRGVAADSNGNVIISGFFADNGLTNRDCANCGFLASVSPAGDTQWVREIQSIEATACGDLDGFQLFRVTVATDGSLLVGGYAGMFSAAFGTLLSFSADGATLNWAYCDDEPGLSFNVTNVRLLGDGGYLMYGGFRQPNANPPGPDRELLVVTKVDSVGTRVFRREISVSRADGSDGALSPGSAGVASDGAIFLTGAVRGELLPGAELGESDAFMLRLDPEGNPR